MDKKLPFTNISSLDWHALRHWALFFNLEDVRNNWSWGTVSYTRQPLISYLTRSRADFFSHIEIWRTKPGPFPLEFGYLLPSISTLVDSFSISGVRKWRSYRAYPALPTLIWSGCDFGYNINSPEYQLLHCFYIRRSLIKRPLQKGTLAARVAQC